METYIILLMAGTTINTLLIAAVLGLLTYHTIKVKKQPVKLKTVKSIPQPTTSTVKKKQNQSDEPKSVQKYRNYDFSELD